jgi:hypothetical protein
MATMHAAFLIAGVNWVVFVAERALAALAVIFANPR